nr:MAG TPA: holin [Caudoviricetes sp.]
MKKQNLKNWLKAAAVRALKTMSQSAVALIGTSTLITEVNWKVVVFSSILAGVVSLLTSVKGLPEVDTQKVEEEADGQVN